MRGFKSLCGGVIKVQGTIFSCTKCLTELQLLCLSGHSLQPNASESVPMSCIECNQEITSAKCVPAQQCSESACSSGSCEDIGRSNTSSFGCEAAAENCSFGGIVKCVPLNDYKSECDAEVRSVSSLELDSTGSDNASGSESDDSDRQECRQERYQEKISLAAAGDAASTKRSSSSKQEDRAARGKTGADENASVSFLPSNSKLLSTKSICSRPATGCLSPSSTVSVTFEIKVSESFSCDQQASVWIKLYKETIIGRKHRGQYKLSPKKDSTVLGWTADVPISRDDIKSLRYKYYIKDKDGKIICEHFHRATDKKIKRRLEITKVNLQNISSLYQYDLVILPKEYQTSLSKWPQAAPNENTLYEDCVIGLQCMLPDIASCLDSCAMTGDDIITKIRRIVDCAVNCNLFFLNDSRTSTDTATFRKAIVTLFCDQLQNNKLYCFSTSEMVCENRIICVLIMLVILHDMKTNGSDLESPLKLLEHLDWNYVRISVLLEQIKRNFNVERQLCEALRFFVIFVAQSGKANWLLGVPAYHALRRCSTSCDNLRIDRCAKFWGFDSDLEQSVNIFRGAVNKSEISGLLNKLIDVFDQQPLSARSFVAALNEETLLFAMEQHWPLPIDAYTPAVLSFWFYNADKLQPTKSQKPALAIKALDNCAERRLSQLIISKSEIVDREVGISLEILYAAARQIQQVPNISDWIVAFVKLILSLLCIAYKRSSAVEVYDGALQSIGILISQLTSVLQSDFITVILSAEEQKMWDALLVLRWPNSQYQEPYANILKDSLSSRVQKISDNDKIDLYCEADSCNEHVNAILEAAACSVMETVMLDPTVMKKIAEDPAKLNRYACAFNKFFTDSWENTKTDADKVRFILNCSTIRTCFAFPGKTRSGNLSDKCRKCLKVCITFLEEQTSKLMDGRLSYSDLGFFVEHKDSFLTLYELLSKESGSSTDVEQCHVSLYFERRQREKQQFDDMRFNLDILQAHCQNVGIGRIQEFDDMSKDFSDVEVRKLWNPSMPNEEIRPLDCNVCKVVLGEITPELLARVKHAHGSVIFGRMCKEAYEKETSRNKRQKRTCGNAKLVAAVLHTAERRWNSFANLFAADQATFKDAAKLLRYCGNRYSCAQKEVSILVGTDKTNKTGELLQQYHQLLQYCDGAEAILRIKKGLRLTGDFKVIEFIVNMKYNKRGKFSSISDALRQDGSQRLHELCEDGNVKSLVIFAECLGVVSWMKENIKDLTELNIFVVLASTAAEEEALEMEKVACLQASMTGFSPLIFDLHPTADLNVFLEKCHTVWKNLKTNPDLLTQLETTNGNIHWVQHIKDYFGSVEVTTLKQAAAINENGIFEVGCIKELTGVNSLTLEDVLRVTFTVHNVKIAGCKPSSASTIKSYNYSQLSNLQSKLMLVAGKAENDNMNISRFLKMFANATRLANAYIGMHHAGSILFDSWKARFYCGDSQSVNVHVEFALVQKVIRGYRRTSCEDHALELAVFMERCIENWKAYAREKRQLFSELNFFTTKQIVFLRRELANLQHTMNFDLKVYPLLSLIQTCERHDILEALRQSNALVAALTRTNPESQQNTDNQSKKDCNVHVLSEDQSEILNSLTEYGINKELALAGLTACPGGSIAQILQWCKNHDILRDSNEASSGFVNSNSVAISHECRPAETLKTHLSKIMDMTDGDGISIILTEIWSQYLEHASTSLSDFLSIDHLGHVLRILKQKNDINTEVRKSPSGMNRGQTYFITCPQDSMLRYVLTLYATVDSSILPTRNEVLLCTNDTTMEEVDLLFERALTDKKGIYCVAFADRLSYNACELIDRKIGYLQSCSKDHLMVILSSEEKQFSPIKTILDRRKNLSTLKPYDLQHIRKFIQRCLRVCNRNRKVAASLDRESSSTRLVWSKRAGVGKSLLVHRAVQRLQREVANHARPPYIYVPLLHQRASADAVVASLLPYMCNPSDNFSRIVHFDVTPEVQEGASELLFNLLILGSICQEEGYVWQRSLDDYYMVELTSFHEAFEYTGKDNGPAHHEITELLPSIECYSPQQCLEQYTQVAGPDPRAILMDEGEFRSTIWQRVYQHLTRLDKDQDFTDVNPSHAEGTQQQMLQVFLRNCGITNPSWAELKYFVLFLNRQLEDCKASAFCGKAAAKELPGFTKFVVKFMLQMSKDFSTRSLFISEESPHCPWSELQHLTEEDLVHGMSLKRRWEHSHHPYLFFNSDGHTLTFLGFCVDQRSGNIIEPKSRKIIEIGVMPRNLFSILKENKVDLSEDFENLTRAQKIQKLTTIMGNSDGVDPDETYKLTMDNVKKLLAIYMRLRCGIPVVIMGETGCGKTRLIKFMCGLQQPKGLPLKNLLLFKIHGGVTLQQLKNKVMEAYELAQKNRSQCGHMYTVLFLDEANTSDAIAVVKEVMCDGSLNGRSLDSKHGLRIVAAVNPYRKHSENVLKKLDTAGLGYYVSLENTIDRYGSIPMRQLVYRVRSLPPSLLPLVWDFGQLSDEVERIYILQMVKDQASLWNKETDTDFITAITDVLVQCQKFMRALEDECCFVSLRDAERTLRTMSWFLEKSHLLRPPANNSSDSLADQESTFTNEEDHLDDLTWSFVLALGVCYQACLRPETREDFRRTISRCFAHPVVLTGGELQFALEIEKCQTLIIKSLNKHIPDNIARNQALKENILLMIVCIELRIPLFLVGKPGSSKSLAKAIIANAMQGEASKIDFFKHLKQALLISFQCSPLATAEGIVSTFKQAAGFQETYAKQLDKFVSVVVLDEIGLAEDSKQMPLKALHPLLEDGCAGDEEPQPYMKCAFIGISNWALDPAKTNRGIMVERGVPKREELEESARGICISDDHGFAAISPLIPSLAAAYLELYTEIPMQREFFGLRDFYSLIKMIAYFANKRGGMPHAYEFQHAVRRNFGGSSSCKAVDIFEKHLRAHMDVAKLSYNAEYPPHDAIGLIDSCLTGQYTGDGGESRYLLILTESDSILNLIYDKIQKLNPQVIVGSSYQKDLSYTEICRNINRIKVCMETGTPVVLLNLEHLYESLYDALNQYYVVCHKKRFVDLGLGNHRVKCRVHERFRLIVVARKDDVYQKYPIPLINRLEKHFISVNTMLTPEQNEIVQKLDQWAVQIANCSIAKPLRIRRPALKNVHPKDVFVGHTPDTTATLVIKVTEELAAAGIKQSKDEVRLQSEKRLLLIATPESVLRMKSAFTDEDFNRIVRIYFEEQQHECLLSYIKKRMLEDKHRDYFLQVTTRSKLLSEADINFICDELHRECFADAKGVQLIPSLQAIDSEHQLSEKVRNFFHGELQRHSRLLIVQCEAGDGNLRLVEYARHILVREYNAVFEEADDAADRRHFRSPLNRHVILVIQVTYKSSFAVFSGGLWECVHIDDLLPPNDCLPNVLDALKNPLAQLLYSSLQTNRHLHSEDSNAQLEKPFDNGNYVRKINVIELLKMCLHEAASRLRDSPSSHYRPQQRMQFLGKLGHADGCLEFCHLVASGIIELLLFWEHGNPHVASQWLVNEASSDENISRAGTFRKSLEDCLPRKLAPAFAAVIAYCDINDGLDLLDPASKSYLPWLTTLWLKIFASFCVSGSSMMMSFPEQPPNELPVLCKSAAGLAFKSLFPFSWLLKEKLEALSRGSSTSQGKRDLYDAFLANDKEFGDNIRSLSKEQLQECIHKYAHDYLHMTYRCLNHEEHELIFSILQKSLRSTRASTFMDVHCCFSDMRPAINRWSRLMDATSAASRTEIFSNLRKAADKDGALWDTHAIDIVGLREALRVLEKKSNLESKSFGENNAAKEWSSSVHRLRLVIPEIVGAAQNLQTNSQSYTLNECRIAVNRLEAVRLFLEYIVIPEVSATSGPPAFELKDAKLFLSELALSKDFNPKTLTSFCIFEDYFNLWQMSAVAAVYGKEAARRKCYPCGENISRAVLLPCRHLICSRCLHKFYQQNSQVMKCTQCPQQVQFGEAAIPANDFQRKQYERLKNLMRQFSALFIRFLSDMVFDGVDRPEEPLIQKLLSYVIMCQDDQEVAADVDPKLKALTTQLSICIDPSLVDPKPVIRSLLLQLILQASQGQMDVITTYFTKAMAIASQGHPSVDAELCTVFTNCIEDYHYKQVNLRSHGSNFDAADCTSYVASTLCKGTAEWLIFQDKSASLTTDTLSCLAKVRLALANAADGLCQQTFLKSSTNRTIEVIELLQEFFDHAEQQACCFWPRKFLLKYMIRKHGASTVFDAMANPSLRQLMPRELLQAAPEKSLPDLFVIGDDNKFYSKTRNALFSFIVGGKLGHLADYLRNMQESDSTVGLYAAMAICSVVTRRYYNSDPDSRPKPQTVDAILNVIHQCTRIQNKEFCECVLKNSLPEKLCLVEEMGISNGLIALLILRLWAVLSNVAQPKSLLEPLAQLLNQPSTMQRKYLPTMPHDQFLEVRHVMQAMVRPYENLTPYACPNGHIYYLGNCGNPSEITRCRTCGSPIGGIAHRLVPGNRKINPQDDLTKPGHILGPVVTKADQQNVGAAERDLTPASCCIARILLHMTMYASSAKNGPLHISSLVSPTQPDVFEFLWKHVCNDLNTMVHILRKSRDECIYFLHAVIAHLAKSSISGDFSWETHEKRRKWEAELHQKVLAPCIQSCNEIISASTKELQSDDLRTENTLVLSKMLEEPSQTIDEMNLLSNALFWRYRERQGLNHFLSSLENYISSLKPSITPSTPTEMPTAADKYAYLLRLLRSCQWLAAVSHLPAIISTISLLQEEFSRKLTTNDVCDLTIDQFLATLGRSCSHTLEPLIGHFVDAWNAARLNLVSHRFWFHGQHFVLPTEVCSVEMSHRSPVKMLLTGYRGLSLCPLALVTYLAETHNDLLTAYAQAFNKEISTKIALSDVKSVHLITADFDEDVLSTILSNCEYSLKVGETTVMHYNYDTILHQIVERLVQDKPFLVLPSSRSNEDAFRRFLFHEDLTNGYKLEQLSKILKQDPLTFEVKDKICSTYRSNVTDLSDSLSFVDQVIGFLITARTSPDANLCSYARTDLQMKYKPGKHEALENLLAKHVGSLWLLLSMERCRVMISQYLQNANLVTKDVATYIESEDCPWQAWFGDVSSRYAEVLPRTDDGYEALLEPLRSIHRNRLARGVLETLYEFVMFRLSMRCEADSALPQADDDDPYPAHYELFSTLAAYVETSESPYQTSDDGTVTAIRQLSEECPQLLLGHAMPTWFILNWIITSDM